MKKITILSIVPILFMVISGCKSNEKNFAASADGVDISFQVHGQAEPALVFIHGWCCDKDVWKYQVKHFEKNHKEVSSAVFFKESYCCNNRPRWSRSIGT